MADKFDPYHKWLGISPEKQPPNLYQLLGVDDFESDPDVIESAADQRMAHLRKFQSGKHGKLSQQLLNEVSAARVTLLNPNKKSAYDEQMKAELAGADDPFGPSFDQLGGGAALPGVGDSTLQPAGGLAASVVSTKPAARKKPAWILPAGIAMGALAILAVVIVIIVASAGKDEPDVSLAEHKPAGQDDPSGNERSSNGQSNNVDAGTKSAVEQVDETTGNEDASQQDADANDNGESSNPFETVDDPTGNGNSTTPEPKQTSGGSTQPVEATEPNETPKKEPLPSEEQQKPVFATLQETFDLSKQRSSQEQLKLAADFLKLADETTDPTEKFVLLRATMSLAGEGGDALLLSQAVDSIDRHFEINRLDIGQKALLGFANSASTEQAFGSLVEASATFIEDAITEDRIDAANELAEAVYDKMVKSSAPAKYRKQAYDQRNRLNEMFAQWKKIQAALAKLEKEPDDPGANLVLGAWHCFEQQDWKTGLPYLAKSSNEQLSQLATREMDLPPQSTAELIALADAWWDAAEADDQYKEDMHRRAGYWYETARKQGVAGIQQVKVEQRLEKLKPLAPFSVAKRQVDATSQSDAEPLLELAGSNLLNEAILVLTFEPDTFGRNGQDVLVKDLSGRGNHGAVRGASPVDGKVGKALSFDGKGHFIALPTLRDQLVQDTEALSIAVWLLPRNTSKDNMIFDVGSKGNGSLTLSLFEKENQNFLSFAVAQGVLLVPLRLSLDWNHFAATWNGTNWRVYHNGKQVGEQASEEFRLDGKAILREGARLGSQAKSGYREKRFLDGVIDEFVMMRRAMSPEEVKLLYQLGLSGKSFAQ